MKIKSKAAAVALIGMLNLNLVGCNKVEAENSSSHVFELDAEMIDNMKELDGGEEILNQVNGLIYDEETEEPTETEENIYESVEMVEARVDVNIRDIDGKKLGVLDKGERLPLVDTLDNGKVAVLYNDEVAYIASDYVDYKKEIIIDEPFEQVFYGEEDKTLVVPDYLSASGKEETVTIPALECFEVFGELEDSYLVGTNDYFGYITKENIVPLTGTFVVVDISEQQLKLYKDNEVILTAPVVTGKPSTPTDEGIFEIYNITHDRYLVGPGYRSYVNIMMKFNGNEGLHDASYHTDSKGKKHGWRTIEEFGGDTYKTDGSHGCVNMIDDDVMFVAEYVGLGTKVLVHK